MASLIHYGKFAGKVAVVTASTQGIGFAVAERLAQEGAKVVISSRKQNHVEEALEKLKSQGLKVSGLVCHVANSEDRTKLFDEAQKFGGVDILVSNAAVNPTPSHSVLDCPEKVWDKIFDVNLKASYLLAKEALPLMRKRKNGRIIFVSTISAYNPLMALGAYSVSKVALLGLTKAAALQLGKENITVNCVAPGLIQTKFATILIENKETRDYIVSEIPSKRLGRPSELSGVVSFLASEDASYITGETIVVAGGIPSRL